MRKVKLQMHISIDGFVAGPEGQLDWMTPGMDPAQLALLQQLTESMDTILLGRQMTNGFISYWENVVDTQPDSPEYDYAKIFVDTPKIVFSRTVKTMEGRNLTVENSDLVKAVKALKQLPGKDIIVYGGANFVSSLIKNNLLDEINLFVNPVALGKGLTIFPGKFDFKLAKSVAFGNGIIGNQYLPA